MKIRNIAGNIQTLLLSHICVSVLFLLLIFELGLEMEPVVILIYACLSAGSYYMLLKNEWERSRDLSLEIVYLVGCVFRFVIPSFVTSWMIFNDSKIIYFTGDVSDYAFPAIVWMNIFHILFYTVFKLKAENVTLGSKLRDLFDDYDIFKIIAVIYLISFPFRAFNYLLMFFDVSQYIRSMLNNVGNLSIILMLFNCAYKYTKTRHVLLIAFCVAEFVYASFFTYYKVYMIMPIVFYLIFWVVWRKNEKKKVLTKGFWILCFDSFVFINGFVFPFMGAKRVVAGFSVELDAGVNDYSISDVFDYMKNGHNIDEIESNTLLDRQDAVPVNTYFYKDVITKNKYHSELLVKSILVTIPRIIYPEKPYNNLGKMATEYVRTGVMNDKSTASCFTYVGLLGGSYLWGGPLGVVICAILIGYFMSLYNNFLLRNITNPLAIMYYMLFLVAAMSAFEETHDGGIGRLLSFIPIAILVKATSFFLARKK